MSLVLGNKVAGYEPRRGATKLLYYQLAGSGHGPVWAHSRMQGLKVYPSSFCQVVSLGERGFSNFG